MALLPAWLAGGWMDGETLGFFAGLLRWCFGGERARRTKWKKTKAKKKWESFRPFFFFLYLPGIGSCTLTPKFSSGEGRKKKRNSFRFVLWPANSPLMRKAMNNSVQCATRPPPSIPPRSQLYALKRGMTEFSIFDLNEEQVFFALLRICSLFGWGLKDCIRLWHENWEKVERLLGLGLVGWLTTTTTSYVLKHIISRSYKRTEREQPQEEERLLAELLSLDDVLLAARFFAPIIEVRPREGNFYDYDRLRKAYSLEGSYFFARSGYISWQRVDLPSLLLGSWWQKSRWWSSKTPFVVLFFRCESN